MVEEYRCEDADTILVTMGSMTGTAREAIDAKREEGIKVGLLKVRVMRPFPVEKVRNVLSGRKAFAVVDRNVCFGWNTGALYMEVKAASGGLGEKISSIPAIGGLGGADITQEHFMQCIDLLEEVKKSQVEHKTVWLKKEGIA